MMTRRNFIIYGVHEKLEVYVITLFWQA